MRPIRLFTAALVLTLLPVAPAFAVNKDMVQLQTQIQQLQDAVARLQQSNDERMGVLKDLVQQSADSVNRMSVNIDTLQKQLSAQQAAQGAKIDTVSGQVSALNDSLDEIKARMNRLEKALNDVVNQQQTIAAALQNLPPAGTPATTQPQPQSQLAQPDAQLPTQPPTQPLASAAPAAVTRIPPPSRAPAAAPVEDLYKSAYGDYMSAKYPIASSEFLDITRTYPENELAGNAFYYLGEIDYRAGKYAQAAKDYDRVLEQFPDNNKIPAAHLHKGQALIALKQDEAGIRELRALIQRFPASPEAAQARSKLSGMGVPVRPRT